MPPERQPEYTMIWELVKGSRRLVCYIRKIDAFDALELRYEIDGRFIESRMYRGAERGRMRTGRRSEAKGIDRDGVGCRNGALAHARYASMSGVPLESGDGLADNRVRPRCGMSRVWSI